MNHEMVRRIVSIVIRQLSACPIPPMNRKPILIGVSERHAHFPQNATEMRHIHMQPSDADFFGVKDGQEVLVRAGGERAVIFDHVVVKVSSMSPLEFHIDPDEANAAGVRNGDSTALLMTTSNEADVLTIPASLTEKECTAPELKPENLLTEEMVRQAWKKKAVLIISKGVICTPLAKDAIRELGVRAIWK